MMLNNNRKAAQAKGEKTEPDFGSILERILNLDTQKKTSEARSMMSALRPREREKPSTESSEICPYSSRPGQTEEKSYYKHQERASEDFRQKFQNRIKEFQSKANATRTQSNIIERKENEANCIYVVQSKGVALATEQYDISTMQPPII